MSIDELREIRERRSIEALGMTPEQLNAFFKKGADEIMKMIMKKRAEDGNKVAQTTTIKNCQKAVDNGL